jgi:uncharacterized membrane protein YgdD (TMEM256/DUF423 family)
MSWIWRAGVLHILVGSTILFGSLHPLRDMLDAHELHLAIVGSSLEAIQGVALLLLSQYPKARWPALLIALGTAAYAAMLYVIIFTGLHPLDLVVPSGGGVMLLGWILLLFSRRPDRAKAA